MRVFSELVRSVELTTDYGIVPRPANYNFLKSQIVNLEFKMEIVTSTATGPGRAP
jgi:hypothetical protein